MRTYCEKVGISYCTFYNFLIQKEDLKLKLLEITKKRNAKAKRIGLLFPAHIRLLNTTFAEIGAELA